MNDNLENIVSMIIISKKRSISLNKIYLGHFFNICMIVIGILKPFHISMNTMIASFAM